MTAGACAHPLPAAVKSARERTGGGARAVRGIGGLPAPGARSGASLGRSPRGSQAHPTRPDPTQPACGGGPSLPPPMPRARGCGRHRPAPAAPRSHLHASYGKKERAVVPPPPFVCRVSANRRRPAKDGAPCRPLATTGVDNGDESGSPLLLGRRLVAREESTGF